MSEFWEMVLDPQIGLRTVFVLLAAKFFFAVLRAAKERQLDWRRLPEFIQDDILPYGTGLLILWLLTTVDATLKPAFTAATAAVSAMLLRQVGDHFSALFGLKKPE